MSAMAIIMMIIMLVTVWGGLVAAAIHLVRNPDESSGTDAQWRAQHRH